MENIAVHYGSIRRTNIPGLFDSLTRATETKIYVAIKEAGRVYSIRS